MTRFPRFLTRTLLIAAFAAIPLIPAAALAEPAEGTDQATPDPLSGPGVKDRNAPGGRERFGRGPADRGARRGQMPFEAFMGAVRALGGPETPDELVPSAEQREQLRAVMEDYRAAMEAFRAEHKEEIDSLMKQAGLEPGAIRERARERFGERRGERAAEHRSDVADQDNAGRKPRGERGSGRGRPGGPGGPGGEELTAEQKAAREKLRELRETSGPNADDYRARVWSILTSSQKQYVEQKIADFRARGGPEGMMPPPPPGPRGGGDELNNDQGRPDAPKRRGRGAKKNDE